MHTDPSLLALASEYLQVRETVAALSRRREELKAQLKSQLIDFGANVALLDEVVVGQERLVPTLCEASVVDTDALRERISKAMWNRITVQVLDMQAYAAARDAGQIKPAVVEAVEATSTYWQLRTFTNLPKQPVRTTR